MSDQDFPKLFREQQINSFVTKMEEASTFKGPNNDTFNDEFIDIVLEEVRSSETDLTGARVAIEKYVIGCLAKDPDNIMMMRLHDKIKPIIQEVIDIEIKMYGAPKYIVTKSNNDASAWSLSSAAEAPIHSISLPTDVQQEVQKYNFTTVKQGDVPVLPDSIPDINDDRCEFFKPLVTDENEKTEDVERLWLEKFKEEKSFAIIDACLLAVNQYEQISFNVTDQLLDYVTNSTLRTAKSIEYEQNCFIPEPDMVPNENVVSARNSSLRAFFTLLHITSTKKDEFIKSLIEYSEYLKSQGNINFEPVELADDYYDDCVDSLIKMYAKHPLDGCVLFAMKQVFKFIDEDQRKHFYIALNDWAAYYEERGFFASSKVCYELKAYLTSEHNLQEKENIVPPVEETPIENEDNTSQVGVFFVS